MTVQPHILCGKGDIAKYVILAGDPGRVIKASKFLEHVKKTAENRGLITYHGTYKGVPVTISTSGMGGPSAAIVVEELIKCGAEVIIRVGSGCAMQEGIKTGDTVISTGAVRDEGTTKVYVPIGYPAVPSLEVVNALIDEAKKLGYKHHVGLTVTHDALYREDWKEWRKFWHEKGLIGGEMETSTIFVICRLRGVKAGSVFNVGTEYPEERMAWRKDKEMKFLEGEKKSIRIALEAILKLEKEVN